MGAADEAVAVEVEARSGESSDDAAAPLARDGGADERLAKVGSFSAEAEAEANAAAAEGTDDAVAVVASAAARGVGGVGFSRYDCLTSESAVPATLTGRRPELKGITGCRPDMARAVDFHAQGNGQ